MLDRLARMDRRVIYAVVFLSLSIPLIWPIGLGVSVGPETQKLYDIIESLPSGSAVIVSMDTSPGGYGELASGTTALLNHMARKGLRVIGMGFFDTGPSLLETAFGGSEFRNKEYGKDYVNLGYLAGGETAIAAMARDIPGSFPRDYRGNVTSSLPIMEGIKSVRDVALIVTISSGTPGVPEWIRQVGDPMKVPIATVLVAVNVPNMTPYIQAGQLKGMIPSMKGAAGYESLMGVRGLGTAGMDAQSVSHLVILAFVILGNVVHLASKKPGVSKGGVR
ncbi:MAG: hypothetical protein IMF26_09695 [Candidatus Fermentithermobacillus carboniphilus]|uniref:Uncharacterized protein n=1 Tax=Candidatus Fermentithermobacillus carboniphilus TaxID=3085328 RepID=A0AAT9LAX3_9FIRM|nr:MAG: hypothetical protein IMF26_09695 [Candidatus Fermentithermobacillus carboniphilus]